MVDIRRVDQADEWDALVLKNGGHPLQLWGWGETKAKYDWSAHRYVVTENGAFLGGAQVLIRDMPWPISGLAYVPRGPFFGTNTDAIPHILNALRDELKRRRPVSRGIVALSVEPDTEQWPTLKGWQKATNRILPADTIRLDLSQDESALFGQMSKKNRQYIRKSAADLDPIRRGSVGDLDVCFEIYRDTAKRAQFALRSESYYRDVFAELGERNELYLAEKDGVPVAFLWNAHSSSVAFELYGGVNAEGQRLRANYALKWFAIQQAQAQSITAYDMGGLIEGGVSTFKRGWAADDTHLAGTFNTPLSIWYPVYDRLLPLAKKIVKRIR